MSEELSFFEEWESDPLLAFSNMHPALVFGVFYVLTMIITVTVSCCRWGLLRKRRARALKPQNMANYAAQPTDGKAPWRTDAEQARSSAGQGEGLLPAYGNNVSVEFFSVQHGKWLAAMMHTQLRGSDNESLADQQVVYCASLKNSTKQRIDVSVDLIREPFVPGERVEAFVASQSKWIPAEVGTVRKTSGMQILYSVQFPEGNLHAEDGELPASMLRRRYDVGRLVEVYRGEMQGWCSVEIAAGKQMPIKDDVEQRMPAKLYWKQIPIKSANGMQESVPSFLLRPVGSPLIPAIATSQPTQKRDNTMDMLRKGDNDLSDDNAELNLPQSAGNNKPTGWGWNPLA